MCIPFSAGPIRFAKKSIKATKKNKKNSFFSEETLSLGVVLLTGEKSESASQSVMPVNYASDPRNGSVINIQAVINNHDGEQQ